MWPSVLRKFAPAMVMLWPAEPFEGLNDEITGGPFGATATVVDVEVVDEDEGEVVPAVRPRPPDRGPVECDPVGAAVVGAERVAFGAGADGPAITETSRAMAAAATRAATAATERVSQRSRPGEGGRPPGAPGRTAATGAVGSAGVATCPRVGVGSGGGAIPVDSRARRTALSMAPRARWPGDPGGGPAAACSSAIDPRPVPVPRTIGSILGLA
jgi:hypothetical protein